MKNVAAAVSGPMINPSTVTEMMSSTSVNPCIATRPAIPDRGPLGRAAHHGARFTIIMVRSNDPSPACTSSVSSWLPRSVDGQVVENVAGDRSPFQ